jgi:hypothetical protein
MLESTAIQKTKALFQETCLALHVFPPLPSECPKFRLLSNILIEILECIMALSHNTF